MRSWLRSALLQTLGGGRADSTQPQPQQPHDDVTSVVCQEEGEVGGGGGGGGEKRGETQENNKHLQQYQYQQRTSPITTANPSSSTAASSLDSPPLSTLSSSSSSSSLLPSVSGVSPYVSRPSPPLHFQSAAKSPSPPPLSLFGAALHAAAAPPPLEERQEGEQEREVEREEIYTEADYLSLSSVHRSLAFATPASKSPPFSPSVLAPPLPLSSSSTPYTHVYREISTTSREEHTPETESTLRKQMTYSPTAAAVPAPSVVSLSVSPLSSAESPPPPPPPPPHEQKGEGETPRKASYDALEDETTLARDLVWLRSLPQQHSSPLPQPPALLPSQPTSSSSSSPGAVPAQEVEGKEALPFSPQSTKMSKQDSTSTVLYVSPISSFPPPALSSAAASSPPSHPAAAAAAHPVDLPTQSADKAVAHISLPDLSSISSNAFLDEDDSLSSPTASSSDSENPTESVSPLFPLPALTSLPSLPSRMSSTIRSALGFGRSKQQEEKSNESGVSASSSESLAEVSPSHRSLDVKSRNFTRLLESDPVDLTLLRRQAWAGIPPQFRGPAWRLLLGYAPVNKNRRQHTLEMRRVEYTEYLYNLYYQYAASASPSLSQEERFKQINPDITCDSANTEGSSDAPSASSSSSSLLSRRSDSDLDLLKQIRQDVPRTSPGMPFFKRPTIQRSMERVLYIYAVRHPAAGYVQGMNDILTPFYCVFIRELLGIDLLVEEPPPSIDSPNHAPGAPLVTYVDTLPPDGSETDPLRDWGLLLTLESHCYWCLSSLLDALQDNYTFAQPGVQRLIFRLQELVGRIDGDAATQQAQKGTPATHMANKQAGTVLNGVHSAGSVPPPSYRGLPSHFDSEHVQFIHFAFRWMTCLLLREIKLALALRLWDSYLAEGSSLSSGFKDLHVYFCSSFLLHWKEELKLMDFQRIIQFIQRLPTEQWTEKDIETLLAQAHVYKTLFHHAPQHLA